MPLVPFQTIKNAEYDNVNNFNYINNQFVCTCY
jgi:hypothetical protein